MRPASAQVTFCVSPLPFVSIQTLRCSVDRGGWAVCCCVFALIFGALHERAEGRPRGSVFDWAWNPLSRSALNAGCVLRICVRATIRQCIPEVSSDIVINCAG